MRTVYTHTTVMYVDFTDEGVSDDSWPRGYFLTHGSIGTITKSEPAWPHNITADGLFWKGRPERPIVSFDINWFRRMRQRQGYAVPSVAFENDAYNPKIMIDYSDPTNRHHVVDTSNKEEVKTVEDVRAKVQNILNVMSWPDVIKHMPDGDERAFLLRRHGNSDEDLPGEMPLTVRKVAAYNYLTYTYRTNKQYDLEAKYGQLMRVQLLELERQASENNIVIDRSATTEPATKTKKEDKTMAKSASGAAAVAAKSAQALKKKGSAVAAGPVKKVKGAVTKEQVTEALRTVPAQEAPIIKLASEAFGVVIEKGSLSDAPNGGVMKMRAGNIIRGALKREGRFAE